MPSAGARAADRYAVLKRAVLDVGWIRRGSVVRRFMPCGKSGCACQATPPMLHGPYYQWTRKLRGKTVTARLTPGEAKRVQEWIANGRKLNQLVAQMEALSLRRTEQLLRQRRTS